MDRDETRGAVRPQTLLTLANLGRPRRPSGAAVAAAEPVLPTATVATSQLGSLIPGPVTEADVSGLRRLQRIAGHAAAAFLRGDMPDRTDVAALNEVARDSAARVELSVAEGTLRRDWAWDDDTSVAGYLARHLIGELAAMEPARLRECARQECTLLFYDTTRSRTRRWHAEDPCGWRERQQAHRAQD
jgi:predicted RNA-binding Zn ribbon-like protein